MKIGEKYRIQNRKGENIVLLIEFGTNGKSAVLMHGLGGNYKQRHIQCMADILLEYGYTVVRFDTTCSFGESGGQYIDATLTQNCEDLEDVISWCENQDFFSKQFILGSHSFGGVCICKYAFENPDKVLGLFPTATVVSGGLSCEARERNNPGSLDEWKKSGVEIRLSASGNKKELPWSHMEDRLKYDILLFAHKLFMPVFMLVGTEDSSCPVDHQQKLYDVLPVGKKKLYIVEGAEHNFRFKEHLDLQDKYMKEFMDKYGL